MCVAMRLRVFVLVSMLLLPLGGQAQTEGPKRPSARESESAELGDLKADVAKMQALLNQMQANYGLVGNPTSPANHQLQLNIDMWRILIGQMQRRIDRMEQDSLNSPAPQKESPSR